MASKTSEKALAIFFLAFGIALAVFIVVQGIDLFRDSRSYVGSTGAPSVDCIKYFYEVGGISYGSGELSFSIRNLDYSFDIENMTVVGSSPQILQIGLPRGSSQQVRVGADLTNNFSVYPSDCSVYKVVCMLDTGICSPN